MLLYRTVNYESDNLVFAEIYATFMVASLSLAGLCSGLLVWNWLRPPPRTRLRERKDRLLREHTGARPGQTRSNQGSLDILAFPIH